MCLAPNTSIRSCLCRSSHRQRPIADGAFHRRQLVQAQHPDQGPQADAIDEQRQQHIAGGGYRDNDALLRTPACSVTLPRWLIRRRAVRPMPLITNLYGLLDLGAQARLNRGNSPEDVDGARHQVARRTPRPPTVLLQSAAAISLGMALPRTGRSGNWPELPQALARYSKAAVGDMRVWPVIDDQTPRSRWPLHPTSFR